MNESAGDLTRPTAFVSYAQSGDDWQKAVLQFTTALRRVGGIDAELDLFHGSDHRQWTTFGLNLIDKSDFTLVAVDAAYKRRWEGEEAEGVGAGAAREAAAIKAIFERSQAEALRRVKVVLLPGSNEEDIPGDLLGFSERFIITAFGSDGLDALLRSLWGKPAFPKPSLGPIPVLPPLAIAELQDQDEEPPEPQILPSGEDASRVDERDREALIRRLNQIDEALKDRRREPNKPDRENPVTADLEREVAILRTSLEELGETRNLVQETNEGDAVVSPKLLPFLVALDDNDESVRFEAMAALGDRLEPSLLPRIEGLLDDADPYIRRYALDYYSRLTGKEATERIAQALDDNDESVRFEAMAALGDRLEPSLLPRIEGLLDDADPYIRRYALDYYSRLTGKEATERIAQALDDNDESVRFEAMAALGDRLEPSLLPRIEGLLDDADPYIRRYALDYYSRLT